MQAVIYCHECFWADPECYNRQTTIRIPEGGVLDMICEDGHRTIFILQEMKFELLSQMAIVAIVDEYYREAVVSFAGALERLYEFFVRVVCHKRDISKSVFERVWKAVSNQSERQFGAFLALYAIETGEFPKLLPEQQISFRNSVIHKGRIPDRVEAVQFGQSVLDSPLPVLQLLKSPPYKEAVQVLVFEGIVERSKPFRDLGLNTGTQSIATLFGLVREEPSDIETAVRECPSYLFPPKNPLSNPAASPSPSPP